MKKMKIKKEIEEEVELSACFNCGAIEEPEVKRDINIDGPNKYLVYCFSCGCTGPHMLDTDEAIKWWNILGAIGETLRFSELEGHSVNVAPPTRPIYEE